MKRNTEGTDAGGSYPLAISVPHYLVKLALGAMGIGVSIELDKIPNASLVKALNYGLTQLFSDAYANVPRYVDAKGEPCADKADARQKGGKPERRPDAAIKADAQSMVDKRVTAFEAGELREGAGRTVDPLVAVARRVLCKALSKRGVKSRSIPKLPNLDAIKACAKAHKIPVAKLISHAEALVEMEGGADL